jgi:hypothetical protein
MTADFKIKKKIIDIKPMSVRISSKGARRLKMEYVHADVRYAFLVGSHISYSLLIFASLVNNLSYRKHAI